MKDPVCGMVVTEESAVGTRRWKGTVYGFCSEHCLESFDKTRTGIRRREKEKKQPWQKQ